MTTVDAHDMMEGSSRDRKAEILRLAQDAVERRGQRRQARRHALAMVAITAAATVLAVTLTPSRTAGPGVIAGGGTGAASSNAPSVVRVVTTAGLAETLAARETAALIAIVRASGQPASTIARVATTPSVPRIGDTEALDLLAEAGTPAGLIRVGGRTTLVYHESPESTDLGPSGHAVGRGMLLARW